MCLIKNTKVEVADNKSRLMELDKVLKSIEREVCRNKSCVRIFIGDIENIYITVIRYLMLCYPEVVKQFSYISYSEILQKLPLKELFFGSFFYWKNIKYMKNCKK